MENPPDHHCEQPDLFACEPDEAKREIPVFTDGRDELNLAEFPLASLSTRGAPDQKTLEFQDTIYDAHSRQLVERKLTITGADKFGLPNALDDEVILALIQLSKRQGFTSSMVPFSRYEIIQILGWEDQSWNYHRITQALERWVGITLKYENAWWDPEKKAWANELFHIIERVTEITDDKGQERSAFVWNTVIFSNLRKGHLKALDLGIYRRLKSSAAKRLYRLLDKRFYHRRRVEFDLVNLAYHKLGIAKSYLVGNIKQRLQPAIEELEAVGFIKAAPKEERYSKHGVGQWNVAFEKAGAETLPETPDALDPAPPTEEALLSEVEAFLTQLGVSPQKVRRLVTNYPEEYLRQKIEELRYLSAHDAEKIKNPAGFLVKSIEERFSAPNGFKTPEQQTQEDEASRARREAREKAVLGRQEREREKIAQEASRAKARGERVSAYLAALDSESRELLYSDAMKRELAKGSPFSDWVQDQGRTGEAFRRQALEEFVLGILDEEI
jgi:hypothetical protein